MEFQASPVEIIETKSLWIPKYLCETVVSSDRQKSLLWQLVPFYTLIKMQLVHMIEDSGESLHILRKI